MTPLHRKIAFALSFESLGILLASGALLILSDSSASQSLALSAINATVALTWNLLFNLMFERWEAGQSVKGRPLALRALHALLFEGGLTLVMVPFMAWWLGISLMQAFTYEIALILLFIAYTYAFTWAFDRLFGLPQSAL
ncbi:MAG: PACE efflux transporter [Pseudorhodobacter sp.]|nr:PACE efflux transporter [Pseudorhodobacter sp.]